MSRLAPPRTKGHLSVARLAAWWYVACRSRDLGGKPLARTVLGTPLVVFRDGAGRPGALLDRCPHRNVPLSLGRLASSGALECAYHGWQFDVGGSCRLVPGLQADDDGRGRRVPAFAAREHDGFVWVWGEADVEPPHPPPALPHVGTPGYATIVRVLDFPGTLHATVENALDVPHTAFLHRGLFRGTGERHEIRAVVRRGADRVEAEYIGEPRPEGMLGRLLAPEGGVVEHWDRFVLPSIAEVEYRLGAHNHLLVTSLCTPVDDFVTRMFAVVSFRLRLPAALVRPLVTPLAMRVLRQDAAVLRRQTETVRRFGGEQFVSTELDLLGPHIWRLLREAEADPRPAASGAAPVVEREVRFLA
jgi:phenylpropionate dioxygenase-like ring-hydroxylating dioxygenase large terminal subunit